MSHLAAPIDVWEEGPRWAEIFNSARQSLAKSH